MKCRFLACGLLLSLVSCASVSVSKVDAAHPYSEGVRFFRPWPHLVVTLDPPKSPEKPPAGGGGGSAATAGATANSAKDEPGLPTLHSQVIMLQDPSEEYVINWSSGWFGTANPNFTLTDGWNLTAFNSKVESGTAALLTSLAALIPVFSPQDVDTPKMASIPKLKPGIYRLEPIDTPLKDMDGNPLGLTKKMWMPVKPAVVLFE